MEPIKYIKNLEGISLNRKFFMGLSVCKNIYHEQKTILMGNIIFKYSITILLFVNAFLPHNLYADTITEKDNTKVSVVVIDPGHGGRDPGAVIGSAREKDIVLDISMKLGKYIQTNFPNVKVVYTRTKDVFIPLHKRADIANKNDADLFISVHVNAVDHKGVQGTETFVLGQHRSEDNLEVAKKENAVILLEDDYTSTYEGFDPNSPESYIMFELVQDEYKEQSISLATEIQDQFRERAKRKDRSVKEAGFLVLRETTMPGVLIETGFISHSGERKYLMSETGKTHIASSIYRAFKKYKNDREQKSSFHLVTEDIAPKPIKREEETAEKTSKPAEPSTNQPTSNKKSKEDLYFSVQIMALKKKLSPTPENFKGEKNIFRVDAQNISRYFSGKFNTEQQAFQEQQKLKEKYSTAFIVAFHNNNLISLKKAQEILK